MSHEKPGTPAGRSVRDQLDELAQIDELERRRRASQESSNPGAEDASNKTAMAVSAVAAGAAILAGVAFWPIVAIAAIAFGGAKILGKVADKVSGSARGTDDDIAELRRQARKRGREEDEGAGASASVEVEALAKKVKGPQTFATAVMAALKEEGVEFNDEEAVRKQIAAEFGRDDKFWKTMSSTGKVSAVGEVTDLIMNGGYDSRRTMSAAYIDMNALIAARTQAQAAAQAAAASHQPAAHGKKRHARGAAAGRLDPFREDAAAALGGEFEGMNPEQRRVLVRGISDRVMAMGDPATMGAEKSNMVREFMDSLPENVADAVVARCEQAREEGRDGPPTSRHHRVRHPGSTGVRRAASFEPDASEPEVSLSDAEPDAADQKMAAAARRLPQGRPIS